MIGPVVDVELARHQWAEGRRALERERSDRAAYGRLARGVDVVVAELARRLGQTFTLEELAGEYHRADRWSLELLDDAFVDWPPTDTSAMTDAAFDRYSHRASDYSP
jgi:hypothetical protein